jgi:hypothetical protein
MLLSGAARLLPTLNAPACLHGLQVKFNFNIIFDICSTATTSLKFQSQVSTTLLLTSPTSLNLVDLLHFSQSLECTLFPFVVF